MSQFNKMRGYVLLLLLFIVFGAGQDTLNSNECAFCDPKIVEYQKFYEEDLVMVLYTHKPIFPGHCLIIPKRHVERFEELHSAEITQMAQVIKKVNLAVEKLFGTSTYLLLQKNGKEVGQTVPHVHFHYIPRKTGDSSAAKFFLKMYFSYLQSTINADEMAETVSKLKEAMDAVVAQPSLDKQE